MRILVFNAGSSTLKYALFQMPEPVLIAKGKIERIKEKSVFTYHHLGRKTSEPVAIESHFDAAKLILKTLVDTSVLKDLRQIDAVGHRVVHAGDKTEPRLIDKETLEHIRRFAIVAPLHNCPDIDCIEAVTEVLPKTKQVACFDSHFHRTIPPRAYTYALPSDLVHKYNIRKFGFHGISHQYAARKTAELLNKDPYKTTLISCHLGAGSSVTAVSNGLSVDTSMGFTPLQGLVMATRSGDIDPGILLYLGQHENYSFEQLNEICNKQSGLLGISGLSSDIRDLKKASDNGNRAAKLAVDAFCYTVKKYIGAYLAVLDKLDALVFTGGIGENASFIRQQICADLQHLDLVLDMKKNADPPPENPIVSIAETVPIIIIKAREELLIAMDAFDILG